MLCCLPRSCLVCALNPFDSEGWLGCDQVIFLSFVCLLAKPHAAFKWIGLYAISELPVYPDSAEVQVRWGGKMARLLIAYFLTFLTKLSKWAVCIEVIARQSNDIFETLCGRGVGLICQKVNKQLKWQLFRKATSLAMYVQSVSIMTISHLISQFIKNKRPQSVIHIRCHTACGCYSIDFNVTKVKPWIALHWEKRFVLPQGLGRRPQQQWIFYSVSVVKLGSFPISQNVGIIPFSCKAKHAFLKQCDLQ